MHGSQSCCILNDCQQQQEKNWFTRGIVSGNKHNITWQERKLDADVWRWHNIISIKEIIPKPIPFILRQIWFSTHLILFFIVLSRGSLFFFCWRVLLLHIPETSWLRTSSLRRKRTRSWAGCTLTVRKISGGSIRSSQRGRWMTFTLLNHVAEKKGQRRQKYPRLLKKKKKEIRWA